LPGRSDPATAIAERVEACAMIVGQSVGTAATSAMVAIGAGVAVRRAALAHIVYNVAVGIIGILLLGPLAAVGRWVGDNGAKPRSVWVGRTRGVDLGRMSLSDCTGPG
jgi:Na+/phosphate symporter